MTVHLADAVGELLKAPSMRIHCLPGAPERFYTVRAPSLLDQLADAVANSSGSHAHTVPGPRLPLSAEAIDLWHQVMTSLHMWARDLGLERRSTPTHILTTLRTVSITPMASPSQLLRKLKVAAVRPGAEEIADAIQKRCWCGRAELMPSDCGRCWVHRIQGLLITEVPDREIRGAACTHCRSEQVDPDTGTVVMVPTTTTVIERDGERLRVPAIIVRVSPAPWNAEDDTDLWVYRMCRACGAEGWLDYTTETAA